MPLTDLLRTKIHIAALDGVVREHPIGIEIRTPRVPTFFHGTCLVLHEPPTSFEPVRAQHVSIFGPDVRHRLVVWGGGPASPGVLSEAEAAGFRPEFETSMALDAAPAADDRFVVRPLALDDWPMIEALSREADGADSPEGDTSYREFKAGVRALNRRWIESGGVTWWGAFEGGELIGQCGMAHCDSAVGEGLGRFQAVEVHPDHRRKGVASSLVATVARDAFERLGCPRVLLAADAEGPAVALYERIGFRRTGDVHGLLWSDGALVIRPERPADHANVRAIVTAAFGGPEEARLVESLRGQPGVLSVVAERNGRLLGHVMFSPVEVVAEQATWPAMALAPLAVRPQDQRTGVGRALTEHGLALCRDAGHGVVFVLGDPKYYGRQGFRSASPLGLTCAWPAAQKYFQVIELDPGSPAERNGRVRFHRVFDAPDGSGGG